MSTKIDRFGWGQMAKAMKDRLTLDWCDVLSPYRLEDVKQACADLMASNPKHATNEQQVLVLILAARSKALAQHAPEPVTYAPVVDRITPERHAELTKEYGFKGGTVKSFNAKPEEIK